VHRLNANRSYLMRGTAGNADLQPGDVFRRSDDQEAVRVEVTGFDATNRVARVRLSLLPTKPTAIGRAAVLIVSPLLLQVTTETITETTAAKSIP
jgi:hypothetical protein